MVRQTKKIINGVNQQCHIVSVNVIN